MWKKITLTTADNTARISFQGRGSIYAEGTFGGGQVGAFVVYQESDSTLSVSSGYIDEAIDGSVVKSIDCPSGHYELNLFNSSGATVDVYYNEQFGISK